MAVIYEAVYNVTKFENFKNCLNPKWPPKIKIANISETVHLMLKLSQMWPHRIIVPEGLLVIFFRI